jgi:hypothetical protein
MKICKTCGKGATTKALDAIRPRKARKPRSKPPTKLSNSVKTKLYLAKYLQRYEE